MIIFHTCHLSTLQTLVPTYRTVHAESMTCRFSGKPGSSSSDFYICWIWIRHLLCYWVITLASCRWLIWVVTWILHIFKVMLEGLCFVKGIFLITMFFFQSWCVISDSLALGATHCEAPVWSNCISKGLRLQHPGGMLQALWGKTQNRSVQETQCSTIQVSWAKIPRVTRTHWHIYVYLFDIYSLF